MRQRCAALRVAFAFGRFFCFFSQFPPNSLVLSSAFTLISSIASTGAYSIAVTRCCSDLIPSCPKVSRPCNRDVAFPARKPLHLPEHRRHRQPAQFQAVILILIPLWVVSLLNEPLREPVYPGRKPLDLSFAIFVELSFKEFADYTGVPRFWLTRQRSRHTNMIYHAICVIPHIIKSRTPLPSIFTREKLTLTVKHTS